jgi:hypothetical protein
VARYQSDRSTDRRAPHVFGWDTERVRAPLLLCIAIGLLPAGALGHGGGLDSYGCHNDRKHGGYHCHRGTLAGQSFSSKQEMLQVLEGAAPSGRSSLRGGAPAQRCGAKHYCKEMSSCEEALFYLTECGLTRLDRDGDGVPCESLCR